MLPVIISLLVLNTLAFLIPKRLSKIEMYSTSLFALLWGHVVDMALDLKLTLYYYYKKGLQWVDFMVPFLIYPSITILFLNFYPYNKANKSKIFYILGWSIFSITFEAIVDNTGFFTHVKWKLWHSAFIYPLLFIILLWHLKLIRKLIKNN
ncbi:CBO0543 family protein [Bacillus sp. AFS040349]|uniref:CBO0543 family protein n=1 Tax=Bacillus sp. AFS040349 TaxID=2033502 RepID=UPI000BFC361A|nr:CBO0543 family protein [Bacillus sp. AFS040349]PGT79782.1 hypothetical protein COD11_22000 [Bacillus sp. AFS040349]